MYPCEHDGQNVVKYMNLFRQNRLRDDRNILFLVTDEDIQSVESACQAVLRNYRRISRFFLCCEQLNDMESAAVSCGNETEAFGCGGVFPHIRGSHSNPIGNGISLSETASSGVGRLRNPKVYFESQYDAAQLMIAELESAKQTLLKINKACGYLMTTNVDALRTYVSQLERPQCRNAALLQRVNVLPGVAEEAEGIQDDGIAVSIVSAEVGSNFPERTLRSGDQEASEDTKGRGTPRSDTMTDIPDYRKLLAIPVEELPSPQVQKSFIKFIQLCNSVLEWLHCILDLLDGKGDIPKAGTFVVPERATVRGSGSSEEGTSPHPTVPSQHPRTKTVRVRRYEIRDVDHIYELLFQQAECFFLPEYAKYDARIQQRLLHPSYFYALRILIDDISVEIERLEEIASLKRRNLQQDIHLSPYDVFQYGAFVPPLGGNAFITPAQATCTRSHDGSPQDTSIVFCPSLPQFYFLRNSLRIFLSLSINEDDLTSLLYYEELYVSVMDDTRSATALLQDLPRPPSNLTNESSTGALPRQKPRSLEFIVREGSGRELLAPGETRWVISMEERDKLLAGFEAYNALRYRLQMLKSSLDKDIRRKDESHRTRVLSTCVAGEMDSMAMKAVERRRQLREQVLRERRESSGWIGAAKASLRALAGVATCKAEVQMEDLGIPAEPLVDDSGVEMTTTSPYHEAKSLVQQSVYRMWESVEAHGIRLEHIYPGLFFRGQKELLAHRMDFILKKANAVSVVFSP